MYYEVKYVVNVLNFFFDKKFKFNCLLIRLFFFLFWMKFDVYIGVLMNVN